MVSNCSEVTQWNRNLGGSASFQAAVSPSSTCLYFTQGRSKQALCPFESRGQREVPSFTKKSEVLRVPSQQMAFYHMQQGHL